MKFMLDHINVSIPVLRIVRNKEKSRKTPKEKPIRSGSVVVTRNCLDVGYVAEVSKGKPTKVYSRYSEFTWPETDYPQYGGVETVHWYDTGIRMTFEERKQLCITLKDAGGFYDYWHLRLQGMVFD